MNFSVKYNVDTTDVFPFSKSEQMSNEPAYYYREDYQHLEFIFQAHKFEFLLVFYQYVCTMLQGN